MFGIGGPELIVIVVLGLILIGPKKFPQVAKTVGGGLRELRRAANLAQAELRETVNDLVREADLQETVDSLRKDLDLEPEPHDWRSEPGTGEDRRGLRPNDADGKVSERRPRHPDEGLHFDSEEEEGEQEGWDDEEPEVDRAGHEAPAPSEDGPAFKLQRAEGAVPQGGAEVETDGIPRAPGGTRTPPPGPAGDEPAP